jgi:hypothetical protein
MKSVYRFGGMPTKVNGERYVGEFKDNERSGQGTNWHQNHKKVKHLVS